jgi:CENP-S protein
VAHCSFHRGCCVTGRPAESQLNFGRDRSAHNRFHRPKLAVVVLWHNELSMMDHSIALDDDDETALRMAVKHAVWKICHGSSGSTNSTRHNDGADPDGLMDEALENPSTSRLTPQALAVLSELTFQYAVSCLAPDLDAFSTHAGRRQRIVLADVLLAVRKHESVHRRVSDAVETTAAATTASATKQTKASTRRRSATKSTASKPAKDSDDNSTSDNGELSTAVRCLQRPLYPPTTTAGLGHCGSSSSSEIESDRRWAKKVKHLSTSKQASTNQRQPPTKARFRLPSLNDHQNRDPNATAAKWSDSDDSSRSSRGGEQIGAAAETTHTATIHSNTASTTTQSRVESIVANLSLDSLPSDVDNGDNNF